MGDHPLGQVVGFDPVVHGQFLEFRYQSPMTPDDPPNEAFVAEMVQPPLCSVTLAGRIEQGQISGLSLFEKMGFNGNGDGLGKAGADKPAGGHGVTVPDDLDGLLGRHDFALPCFFQRQGREHGVGASEGFR